MQNKAYKITAKGYGNQPHRNLKANKGPKPHWGPFPPL